MIKISRSLISAGSICVGVLLTVYPLVSTLFLVQDHAAASSRIFSTPIVNHPRTQLEAQGTSKLVEPSKDSLSDLSALPSWDSRYKSWRDFNHNQTALKEVTQKSESTLLHPDVQTELEPEMPVRIVIPAIDLDAPVQPVEPLLITLSAQDQQKLQNGQAGQTFQQWPVPDLFAAGWHADSARLGEAGNTVLNGHHNIYGKVFGRLVELEPGDVIHVYSDESIFTYQIANKMILPEKYQEIDIRMTNARWILPSQDERLTLITCWPEQSNTHRLIIVARPVARQSLSPPSKPQASHQ